MRLFKGYGWNSGNTFSVPPWNSEGFENYLNKASERPNLLPSWWNETMRAECVRFAETPTWDNLRREPTLHEETTSFDSQLIVLFEMILKTWTFL
jgi:hypothetical protein